jgi:hypothetical protein
MFYWTTYKMRSTGEIVTREFLREKHYNTSFPASWSSVTADFLGCDPIEENAPPESTIDTVWVSNGLTQDADSGIWKTVWKQQPRFTPEEFDAYKVQLKKDEWTGANIERLQRLAETDYTQLLDTPISEKSRKAFTVYRQALRDITEASLQEVSGSYKVVWPEKPVYEKI